jgi:Na+(H+)/acetate symporter ActP
MKNNTPEEAFLFLAEDLSKAIKQRSKARKEWYVADARVREIYNGTRMLIDMFKQTQKG